MILNGGPTKQPVDCTTNITHTSKCQLLPLSHTHRCGTGERIPSQRLVDFVAANNTYIFIYSFIVFLKEPLTLTRCLNVATGTISKQIPVKLQKHLFQILFLQKKQNNQEGSSCYSLTSYSLFILSFISMPGILGSVLTMVFLSTEG